MSCQCGVDEAAAAVAVLEDLDVVVVDFANVVDCFAEVVLAEALFAG